MLVLLAAVATGAVAQSTTYKVTVKEGTTDATNWSITPAEATTTGVAAGTEVKATYTGTKKVKSVKAVKKVAPVRIAATRANYVGTGAPTASWNEGDQVSVFPAAWSLAPYGSLTAAASTNGSTSLTGELTTVPTAGDNLNLLFPRATWNYTGQKGSLTDGDDAIVKKFNYALAGVTVNEVDGKKITTTAEAHFQNQQAIVKFTLQDQGGKAINATSLNISAASNKLVTAKGYVAKSLYTGGYTCDAGSGGFNEGEGHAKLVDGNKTSENHSKWCTNDSKKVDGIWYCEFHTASAIHVDGYTLTTGDDNSNSDRHNRNPKDWVLKAKVNSGDTWTTIATVTNDATMEDNDYTPYDFIVDTPGDYQYFRFEVSATRGAGIMQLEELELFENSNGTTYGSITVTPASATSEMTVALRNDNASADTYTLTATVEGNTYNYTMSNVTFENGKYYAIPVKMNPKKVSSFSLNKTSAILTIGGGTVTLSTTNVSPSDAVDKTVTWSSSNSSVASVNATTGVVTAKAAGTATITATANDGSNTTARCSVTVYPAGTIVWDSSNCSSLYIYNSYNDNTTIADINLKCNANQVYATWNSYHGGILFQAEATGGYTFTAPTGKKFTKIEMTLNGTFGWADAALNGKLGSGWLCSAYNQTGIYKVTWTGDPAAASVNLLTGADKFSGSAITSIAFTLE